MQFYLFEPITQDGYLDGMLRFLSIMENDLLTRQARRAALFEGALLTTRQYESDQRHSETAFISKAPFYSRYLSHFADELAHSRLVEKSKSKEPEQMSLRF